MKNSKQEHGSSTVIVRRHPCLTIQASSLLPSLPPNLSTVPPHLLDLKPSWHFNFYLVSKQKLVVELQELPFRVIKYSFSVNSKGLIIDRFSTEGEQCSFKLLICMKYKHPSFPNYLAQFLNPCNNMPLLYHDKNQ